MRSVKLAVRAWGLTVAAVTVNSAAKTDAPLGDSAFSERVPRVNASAPAGLSQNLHMSVDAKRLSSPSRSERFAVGSAAVARANAKAEYGTCIVLVSIAAVSEALKEQSL